MKSWKIGAVAGLVAGIVAGIAGIIHVLSTLKMGFSVRGLETLTITPTKQIAVVEITLGIIWGIVLGLIYLRIYDLIPKKGILKGLIYGLFIALIFSIRNATNDLIYGRIDIAIWWLISTYRYIFYGLALGMIFGYLSGRYQFIQKRPKIMKHNMASGIHLGAISGIGGGISVFIGLFLGHVAGFWTIATDYLSAIDFIISHLGAHVFFNLGWGILFGILFVVLYERIPRKNMSKAIIYGMIIYFLTSFQTGIFIMSYGYLAGVIDNIILGIAWLITGFTNFLVFGLLLGLLYRKPTK